MSQEVSIQSLGKRQRLLEWSQRVAECRQSGMSVTRWCQEHSITPKTYYTWQKRVFAFMVEQQKQQLTDEEQEPCFAELPAPQTYAQEADNKLIAHIQVGSASINLYTGVDPEIALALCQALKSC